MTLPLPGSPDGWVERARALADGSAVAPEPRDASTVVLLRDGAAGLEVYLLRRVASMAFAAGMTVFPGGSVDPRDAHLPDTYWSGPPPSAWAAALTADDHLARALVCAAVRETFEESGVLLAGQSAADVVGDTRGDEWEADRLALVDRSLALAELLERRRLVLRADLLRVWGHWVTPELESRRFDTRFFVAALPAGQRTRDVGGEADRVLWSSPAEALRRHTDGEVAMLPPTIATLTDLAAYDSAAAVMAAADTRRFVRVLPKVLLEEQDDGEASLRFLLPGDPDYPA